MSDTPRVFLVTGAASGIGAAVCRRLAAPGTAFLIHTMSNREKAEGVAEQVRKKGGEAVVRLGDMAIPTTAVQAVDAAVSQFGNLDVLIPAAGFAIAQAFGVVNDAAFEKVHQTVSGAFFRLSTAALPHLKGERHGRIVAISAFGAHVFRTDLPSFPASAAAKAALEAQVRSLAVQIAPTGVTVNAVCPGFIAKDPDTESALTPKQWSTITGGIPMGRIGNPDEVAAVVAFLAAKEAAYVTGQVIHCNGGLV
jgi:3-oxoacyl-[acyl-carrier protein] reductase